MEGKNDFERSIRNHDIINTVENVGTKKDHSNALL